MKTLALALLATVAAAPALAGTAETVGPGQPIPYTQLKAYTEAMAAKPLKRTRSARAARTARIGVAADASAIAPDMPSFTATRTKAKPARPANPATDPPV